VVAGSVRTQQATRLTCATADPNCCHLGCTARAPWATKLPAPSQARAVGPAELAVRQLSGIVRPSLNGETPVNQPVLLTLVVFLIGCASNSTLPVSSAPLGGPEATLVIRPSRVYPAELGVYPAGGPIPIQLEISNNADEIVLVTLKDHDKNGRQDNLWGVAARVRNADGTVLTQHDLLGFDPDRNEWWTFAYLHSDFCLVGVDCRMPGDTVTLLPGESVRRVVQLDWILIGAPLLRRPMAPGPYLVELSLNGLKSNTLEISMQ
jgi:hypothetical protein